MVSTNYIRVVMESHDITQNDLIAEWSRVSGSEKFQSGLSRMLKRKTVDSHSLLLSLSNLTGIKLSALSNEISLKDNKLLYSVKETTPLDEDSIDIPITNIRTAASALLTAYNENISDKEKMTVPKNWIRPGTHKLSTVSGESMLATFQPNDLVCSRLLNKSDWKEMKDGYVYEIVNIDNESFIKRVRTHFDRGFITLDSDNPDKSQFPSFNIDVKEISQIWIIEFNITWKFPSPHAAIEDRFSSLEKSQDEIRYLLEQFYNEMEDIKNRQKQLKQP